MKSKIKILFILEATIGGTRTHLNLLTKYLNNNLFDISLICTTKRNPYFRDDIRKMKAMGILVYNMNMTRAINPFADMKSFFQIYKHLKQYHYDIVHTHSSKAGFLGRLAASLTGVKVIIHSPHAFAFQALITKFGKTIFILIERLLSKLTTHFIFVSQSECKLALDTKITHKNNFTIIPNAVEISKADINSIEMKDQLNIPHQHFIIGTVGYYRPQKNWECFIEAMSIIHHHVNRCKFLICGTNNDEKKLQNIIHHYHLSPHMILVPHHMFSHKFYSIMDIFILTSQWEGMPYSLLEAMSYGKPVIATNVTGSCDIINHKKNGLLVPQQNPQRIAESVIHLLSNTTLMDQLGKNASASIIKDHLIQTKIPEFETQYQRLS